jgi:hypothetical protein
MAHAAHAHAHAQNVMLRNEDALQRLRAQLQHTLAAHTARLAAALPCTEPNGAAPFGISRPTIMLPACRRGDVARGDVCPTMQLRMWTVIVCCVRAMSVEEMAGIAMGVSVAKDMRQHDLFYMIIGFVLATICAAGLAVFYGILHCMCRKTGRHDVPEFDVVRDEDQGDDACEKDGLKEIDLRDVAFYTCRSGSAVHVSSDCCAIKHIRYKELTKWKLCVKCGRHSVKVLKSE